MPRGNGRAIKKIDPKSKSIFSEIMGSFSDIKKIELASRDNIIKMMSGGEDTSSANAEMLEDLKAEIICKFNIDHSLDTSIKFICPKPEFDKRRINTLPPYKENTVHRVIVVSGTHEIFYNEKMEFSFLEPQSGLFVNQSSACKINPSQGNFTYDNRGHYNKQIYPGKGFKRPESRYLVIIDFFTEDKEIASAIMMEEVKKTGEKIMTNAQCSGLISNLIKKIGLSTKDGV